MKDECLSKIILVGNPNGQKIDTRGSGVPPIFEWQIASYDRPVHSQNIIRLRTMSLGHYRIA